MKDRGAKPLPELIGGPGARRLVKNHGIGAAVAAWLAINRDASRRRITQADLARAAGWCGSHVSQALAGRADGDRGYILRTLAEVALGEAAP